MTRNDSATVTIDLLFAIVLLIGAVMAAFMIMPNISHEDRDWRTDQYMTATRATDNLVQDVGGLNWAENWTSGNYSNVTKIGLQFPGAETSLHKVIDKNKVEALMRPGYKMSTISTIDVTWWEFPNSSTSTAEREHAARALGLTGYNFYMQLHPVGLNWSNTEVFNSTPLQTNLTNVKGMITTTSAVDRYVYIKNPAGEYLEYDNEVLHYRLSMWVW